MFRYEIEVRLLIISLGRKNETRRENRLENERLHSQKQYFSILLRRAATCTDAALLCSDHHSNAK